MPSKGMDSQLQKFLDRAMQPSEDVQTWRTLVEEEVKSKLSPAIASTPLFDVLVSLERAYRDTRENSPQGKLKDVLVKAGIALERLFAYMLQQHPANNACGVFQANDRSYREQLLNGLAEQWGFHTPIPRSISGVNPGGVKAAAEGRGGTLGQRVVAALLVARLDANHPLRRVAPEAPGLLDDLDSVIELRNQGAHDEMNRTHQLADIQRQVNTTYKIVGLLLGETE